jgi:hypothetical protein
VFIGAQRKGSTGYDPTTRVRADVLASVLEHGGLPVNHAAAQSAAQPAGSGQWPRSLASGRAGSREVRLVGGSKPPASGAIWGHWEAAGYRVKICSRDVDTNAEDLVDTFLHAQALNCVMSRDKEPAGENTLVLCTGDGNRNEGYSSFYDVARNTAERGWRVEVWSWSWALSSRFKALAREYPTRISCSMLDTFWDRITFKAKIQPRIPSGSNQAIHVTAATAAVGDRKPSGDEAAPAPIAGDESDVSAALEDDEDPNICIICLDNQRTHMIMPCNHYSYCEACVTPVPGLCPICRDPVGSIVRVYG